MNIDFSKCSFKTKAFLLKRLLMGGTKLNENEQIEILE